MRELFKSISKNFKGLRICAVFRNKERTFVHCKRGLFSLYSKASNFTSECHFTPILPL